MDTSRNLHLTPQNPAVSGEDKIQMSGMRLKVPDGFVRESVRWGGLLALLVFSHVRWVAALCLVPWGLCSFFITARLGYRAWVGWPLALAGLLSIQCVLETAPSVRQHDVEGHRDYIDYLNTRGRLPTVQEGWETWQPPLYYVLAATWRGIFSGVRQEDSFRSVQALAAVFFLSTALVAMVAFRGLQLNDWETFGALAFLLLIPGYVFFAARINNDVLLPLLGGAITWCTTRFMRTGERIFLRWLSVMLVAILAVKGSSLAVVGAALMLTFGSEVRRSNWSQAFRLSYLTAAPVVIWMCFWCMRTAAQTGDPFYVNANLPESLRIIDPPWGRLSSLHLGAFLTENLYYYDEPVRKSYFTALITSLLYGEYSMAGFGFRCAGLLRWGCLGLLLIWIVGTVVPPRRQLRLAWIACLTFSGCQLLLTVAYAIKYSYACNQNMRFYAQAFVPLAGLFGLGVGRLWLGCGRCGRAVVLVTAAACLVGLADLYFRLFL
jgi:hypothetical protein